MQTQAGKQSGKLIIILQCAMALLVWVYIIYRAIFFEITQDEAYSYALVKTNYWKALPGTFNTHWLNTLSMKIFLLLPGDDYVWKLRLLSMLSWPLFAISIILLGSRFKNNIISLLFFVLCIFNPFMILYFSLARGYAASCALLSFSIWQAGKLIDKQEADPQRWMIVFVSAALSVMANFSSLYFFLALVTVYTAGLIIKRKWKLLFHKKNLTWCLLVIMTIVFAVSSLFFIKYYTKESELDGGVNIIGGLFGSVFRNANFGFLPPGISGAVLFILLLLCIVFAGYKTYKEKKLTLLSFVAFICAAVIVLNCLFHLLFNTVYIAGRAVLFFYILPVLTITGMLDQYLFSGYKKMVSLVFALLLFFGVAFNTYKAINTRFFTEWPTQCRTKEALDYLAAANAKHVALDLWQYSVLKNYYSKAFPAKYHFAFNLADKNTLQPGAPVVNDYILVSQPPEEKNSSWHTELFFPATGTTVLKYEPLHQDDHKMK